MKAKELSPRSGRALIKLKDKDMLREEFLVGLRTVANSVRKTYHA